MKEFAKSWQFRILAGLLALCLGFVIYAGLSGKLADLPRKVMGFFLTPTQSVTSGGGNAITGFFSDIFSASKIKQENERLKEENNKLKDQLVEYHAALRENDNLKDYIGIKDAHADFEMLSATVVERDPTSKYASFSVNKGSMHGVNPRDVVITADGLVGVVSNVGWNYASVTTLLNPDLSVGCICARTGDTGTSGGALDLALLGQTKLGYINKTSGMQQGDLIVTGGSERFPGGLVLGEVKTVGLSDNGSSLEAVIQPAVDIKNVQEVMILTDFYGKEAPAEAATEES